MVEATKVAVTFEVNGAERTVETWPMARLLDVLREDMRLTGTKEGCGAGECGACAALIDGRLVNTCLIPAIQADGARVVTIEGVARGEILHAVQQAFIAYGGAQCGICTPGMVLAAVALLEAEDAPTERRIREGLAGNLCRCTGYTKIIDSVTEAALALRAAEAEEAR